MFEGHRYISLRTCHTTCVHYTSEVHLDISMRTWVLYESVHARFM